MFVVSVCTGLIKQQVTLQKITACNVKFFCFFFSCQIENEFHIACGFLYRDFRFLKPIKTTDIFQIARVQCEIHNKFHMHSVVLQFEMNTSCTVAI